MSSRLQLDSLTSSQSGVRVGTCSGTTHSLGKAAQFVGEPQREGEERDRARLVRGSCVQVHL